MSKSKDRKPRDEQDSTLVIEPSESYKKLEEMALKSQLLMDTFRDSVMRNSGLSFKPIFITDGNGRVLSESEQEKLWEEQRREKEQKRYDKLYGKKKSKKENPEKDVWPDSYWKLGIEARYLFKDGGHHATLEEVYSDLANDYWFQIEGKPVDTKLIGSEYRKAKLAGRIPDDVLADLGELDD